MTERDFKQAIVASPEDDVLRLAFADWLEEQGNETRANFIRTQIEAAKLPCWSLRRKRMEEEADLVRQEHYEEWDPELMEYSSELYCYRRGIAEGVRLWAKDWLKHWPEVKKLAPITRIDLDIKSRAPIDDIVASPYLLEVRELNLSNQQVGDAGARALAGSPNVANLRHLGLSYGELDEGGIEALANSPCLRGLRSLDLAKNRLSSLAVNRMPGPTFLGGLDEIDLDYCLRDCTVVGLLWGFHWKQLKCIDLGQNELAASDMTGLTSSRYLKTLVWLRVPYNNVGDDGVEALAGADWPELAALDLTATGISSRGARALLESKLPNLASLDLRGNRIHHRTAAKLRERFGDEIALD